MGVKINTGLFYLFTKSINHVTDHYGAEWGLIQNVINIQFSLDNFLEKPTHIRNANFSEAIILQNMMEARQDAFDVMCEIMFEVMGAVNRVETPRFQRSQLSCIQADFWLAFWVDIEKKMFPAIIYRWDGRQF